MTALKASLVGWGLFAQVDPDVLNITRAIGAASGYFLWEFADWWFEPYPTQLSSINATEGLANVAEMLMPLPAGGAGDPWSGLKLVTLEFRSKSETAYSKIDLPRIEYYTANGDWYPVNEIVGGHYNQPVYHNLTVESTPIDGINFTIDTTTYTTNRSINLTEGNHTVSIPSTWKVGAHQYNFVEWEDNSTNPIRVISLTSNLTITATYELAKNYILMVNSLPITGINFMIDKTTYTTNMSVSLLEGFYTVSMPSIWINGTDQYNFLRWKDDSTNPVRTIALTSNITMIATYELYVRPVKYILFDQTHGTNSITSYSVWVANLTERDYIVDTHTTGSITSTVLTGYNIFVIPEAHDYYSSDELSAIQDFVLNGGGLLVIGDDNPYIYTDLTGFADIDWISGGVSGITYDITPHDVTVGVTSVKLQSPLAEMLVMAPAQDLVRDPAGGIMLAASEQVGRVIGFADEGSLMDYDALQEDNLRLANNMIDWLRGIRYEHELAVALDAPDFLEPGDSSLLNATVYNIGLNSETDVELFLLINGTIVGNATIPELLIDSCSMISHFWTPTVEATYNVTAYVPPVPDENGTANNVVSKIVRVRLLPKLLVVDTPSSEDTRALDILEYEYTLVTPTEFATVDLYQYNVLFIGWIPGDALVDALFARSSEIADWVAAGNGIVALAEIDEVNRWAWLPLWVSGSSYDSGDTVHILNPAHPVMSDLTDTELSVWVNSYHGYFISYDPAWEALAEGIEAGQPITLAATYGSGRVVITYQDPDFHLVYGKEEGAGKLLRNMIEWITPHIRYEHELTVTLDTPTFLEPSNSSLLNATVVNRGLSNETNVRLELFVNDILVNSTVIDFLPANASYTISYMWIPTDEGAYNVTAYAPPVPSENVTINNVATKIVTVTYPLIRPIEGQWANYTLYYVEDDRIISEGKLTFTYEHYVSPYLINVTMWQEFTGYTQTSWMVVNIMNRKIESSGPMVGFGQWFLGWIETDITLDSTVNLLTSTATVVGSKIIEINGYFVDCWELEYQDYYSGIRYIFWYDKISGLLIGMEYGGYPYYYYSINLTLAATNIPIGVLPVASFTYSPSDPFVAEPVTFDASASYDPNGIIVSYAWDFGDNTTGTGLTTNHIYTMAGTYEVALTVTNDEGLANTVTVTVTVSRTTLEVEVDVGSIHFRGEMAEFYVLVSSMGEPVDATINALLYYSNGTLHEDLTSFVEHVATGLYRVPYTIPIDAPTGTYVLVSNASLFTIKGSSLGSFLVSPTLTDAWLVDIEDDIVTIKTDISTIKVSLESINAKIEDIIDMLPFKKEKVAVIDTDIGAVRADLADINAELTAFNGEIATIKTDVGTLTTDAENIELEVTNVDGDTATISTILGTIQGRVISIQDDVVIIETEIGIVEVTLPPTQTTIPIKIPIEWALLLLAATASITVIATLLLRKHKENNYEKPKPPTFFGL